MLADPFCLYRESRLGILWPTVQLALLARARSCVCFGRKHEKRGQLAEYYVQILKGFFSLYGEATLIGGVVVRSC
jgi:hypothetical protein